MTRSWVLADEVVTAKVVVQLAVLQHVPGRGQNRVSDGGYGPLSDHGDRAVASTSTGVGSPWFGWRRSRLRLGSLCSHLLPLGLPGAAACRRTRRCPGHTFAHDARCLGVGNRLISTPISAITTSAARCLTPGIVISSHADRGLERADPLPRSRALTAGRSLPPGSRCAQGSGTTISA